MKKCFLCGAEFDPKAKREGILLTDNRTKKKHIVRNISPTGYSSEDVLQLCWPCAKGVIFGCLFREHEADRGNLWCEDIVITTMKNPYAVSEESNHEDGREGTAEECVQTVP